METQTKEQVTQDGTLELRASQENSVCSLALSGELDLANAETASAELARLEALELPLKVDLSELEFIDSTGIAILVAAHNRLGNRLQVVPSRARAVRRVMAVTGLDEKLPLAPDADGH